MNQRLTVLNVGCGPQDRRPPLGFDDPEKWTQIRMDIDPALQPDVIGSFTDMSAVPSGSVDAVTSSHCIEHLYWHEVRPALEESLRVLKPDGYMMTLCPDLQAAAEMIAQDKLFDIVYGIVTPFDMVYSHRVFVEAGHKAGHTFMEHKSGFTLSVLLRQLSEAGFGTCAGVRRLFQLWVISTKLPCDEAHIRRLAAQHFPRL
jgi:SAM-dependent methyltransferase